MRSAVRSLQIVRTISFASALLPAVMPPWRFRYGASRSACDAGTRVVRHHISYQPPVLIDARMKPWFPAELFADTETAGTVSRRWREYFPDPVAGKTVEMGDSNTGHLDPV